MSKSMNYVLLLTIKTVLVVARSLGMRIQVYLCGTKYLMNCVLVTEVVLQSMSIIYWIENLVSYHCIYYRLSLVILEGCLKVILPMTNLGLLSQPIEDPIKQFVILLTKYLTLNKLVELLSVDDENILPPR